MIDGLGAGGGSERQLALNLRFFDRARFEHLVAHLWDRTNLVPEIEALGVPVFPLRLGRGYDWVHGAWRVARIVRQQHVALIATSLSQADVIGGIAGKFTGRPVVGSLVNTSYGPEWLADNRHLNRWKLWTMRTMRRATLRRLHSHVVAVSDGARDSAVRYLGIPVQMITVVNRSLGPRWLEVGVAAPVAEGRRLTALRRELRLDGAFPALINVGRLVPQKGQRYLLEAVARLVQEFPEIRLVIAGELTGLAELAGLRAALGLEQHVEFLGSRQDVPDLLRLADIAVFPSLYEGFANAVAEACAAGRPCVATRISGVESVVRHRDTALLVEPLSSEQLANAIRTLARNPVEARAMGERARADVIERFSVHRAVQQLEDVYESVLAGRGQTMEARERRRAESVGDDH